MGMFDHIEYEDNCPGCDELLIHWQSKSGDNQFDVLQPFDVEEFHTYCETCKKFVDCKVDAEVIRTVYVKKCEITIKVRD